MKNQTAQRDINDDTPFGCLTGVHVWLPLAVGLWLLLGVVGYFIK